MSKVAVINRQRIFLQIERTTSNGERHWTVFHVKDGFQPASAVASLLPLKTLRECVGLCLELGERLRAAGHTVFVDIEDDRYTLDSEELDRLYFKGR